MMEQGKIPMVTNNKSAMSILESHGLTKEKTVARRPGLTSIQRQIMQDCAHVGAGPPKGFSVGYANWKSFLPGLKEKQMSDGKLRSPLRVRDIRPNSPPNAHAGGKETISSFTSASLLCSSLTSSQLTAGFRVSEKRMCDVEQLKIQIPHYGEVLVCSLVDNYQTLPTSPPFESSQLDIQRLMKPQSLAERSEQRFFVPSASAFPMTLHQSKEFLKRKDAHVVPAPLDQKVVIIETEDINSLDQAALETPSFTYKIDNQSRESKPMKSDEFTFGKEDANGENHKVCQTESGIGSSFSAGDEKQDKGPKRHEFFLQSQKKPTRNRPEKDRLQESLITYQEKEEVEQSKVLSDRQTRVREIFRGSFQGFSSHKIPGENAWDLKATEMSRLSDGRDGQGQDDSEQQEESERYNLYKNLPISDSDEADFDHCRFENLSGSEDLSSRCKLYMRAGDDRDSLELDGSQLFTDEELKSKYQSLLQHN